MEPFLYILLLSLALRLIFMSPVPGVVSDLILFPRGAIFIYFVAIASIEIDIYVPCSWSCL
nr:MAG TPA: hypothetical protein [Caudoviricetes sp.]